MEKARNLQNLFYEKKLYGIKKEAEGRDNNFISILLLWSTKQIQRFFLPERET